MHHFYEDKEVFYREFHIKKKNGKTRRICAPSPALLQIQRQRLSSLETRFNILENLFHIQQTFHGFLKNKNIVTCAMQHTGYRNTITMDISNCFDSISKEMLEQAHPEIILVDEFFHRNGTLAQGFATSPILANLYLIRPTLTLIQYLDRSLGVGNYQLTIYADDVHISTNNENTTKLELIQQMVIHIFNQHHLTINPSKTRIAHSRFGNRRILGIQVGQDSLNPSRKLKKKIRAARHQQNGPSLGGLVTASRMYLPRALRDN